MAPKMDFRGMKNIAKLLKNVVTLQLKRITLSGTGCFVFYSLSQIHYIIFNLITRPN